MKVWINHALLMFVISAFSCGGRGDAAGDAPVRAAATDVAIASGETSRVEIAAESGDGDGDPDATSLGAVDDADLWVSYLEEMARACQSLTPKHAAVAAPAFVEILRRTSQVARLRAERSLATAHGNASVSCQVLARLAADIESIAATVPRRSSSLADDRNGRRLHMGSLTCDTSASLDIMCDELRLTLSAEERSWIDSDLLADLWERAEVPVESDPDVVEGNFVGFELQPMLAGAIQKALDRVDERCVVLTREQNAESPELKEIRWIASALRALHQLCAHAAFLWVDGRWQLAWEGTIREALVLRSKLASPK